MHFIVLTLFTEIYSSLNHSIIGKALEEKKLKIDVIDIRKYSKDKHKKCDDYIFGGGSGMLMTPQPLDDAITQNDPNHEFLRVYLSPKGKILTQQVVKDLSNKYDKIMLINGAYEGIDQRIIDMHVDLEISIGDYILTSGDYASLVLINTISRYVDSVLGDENSVIEESFENNLLEYPQYTRPAEYKKLKVPEVLLSGNHKEIKKWRKEQSEIITKKNRPDLLK
ncbi:MAG TPA: tRNA (guanosine(37)-N1)-methyltransferase TrmD [Clostridiales bacterium]|nr:tRNA (guanosine(37)-N1)-methyltransferase TrmD [Clostridiales bacterium]